MEELALLSQQRNEAEDAASAREELPSLDAAREQIDRILTSDTLRASDAVRRLLRFLADKAFAGEADQLKEYSIGVDALGKPPSFDPRHDAGVRLLASRLRSKLEGYYESEGYNDPVAIEMPRGHFRIVWKTRVVDAPPVASVPLPVAPGPVAVPVPDLPGSPGSRQTNRLKIWKLLAIVLTAVCAILGVVLRWSLLRSARTQSAAAAVSGQSPELEALWSPLLSDGNHAVIAYWNPVFVRFRRSGKPDVIYRGSGIENWDDLVNSPEYAEIRRVLGNPEPRPTLNFTMRGSLVTIFNLSQFFARRRGHVSLDRLDELSWQQVADNDVVLVAPASQIMQRQTALPVSPAFVVEKKGIRNLHPLPGEPQMYEDLDDPQETDGETVELVSMLPGPLGRTRVVSFAGNHSSGLIGSVQSMTDPSFARVLVDKLKTSSGGIPPYFQIVIRIRYRDDTPTYTSYVTHRALMLKQNSADK